MLNSYNMYRILHELSFNIKIYEMSLENISKCYNVSGMSFIKGYIKLMSVRFFLSHGFSAHTNLPL